jgi:hypothetical protein
MIDTILAFIAAYNATHPLPIIFPITCVLVFIVALPLMCWATRGSDAAELVAAEERLAAMCASPITTSTWHARLRSVACTAHASSVADYEALLPWSCSPEMPR